jgi:hypothetical protein
LPGRTSDNSRRFPAQKYEVSQVEYGSQEATFRRSVAPSFQSQDWSRRAALDAIRDDGRNRIEIEANGVR